MEPVISRKRPLANYRDFKFNEIRKRRPLVQAVRDYPPGCGFNEAERNPSKISTKIHSNHGKIVDSDPVETNIFNNSKPQNLGRNKPSIVSNPVGNEMQKKKNFDNVDPNLKKLTLNCKDDKLVKSHPIENSKLKNFEPKESVRNKSYFSSKSTGKVKFWDPNCESKKPEEHVEQEEKEATTIVSKQEQDKREKIQEAIAIFDQITEKLTKENRVKPKGLKIAPWRVPLETAKIVKKKLKWNDPVKQLGHVCGVQVGDTFQYRAQLKMIGLHCQHQAGIDYTKIKGNDVAISIVDAHRYSNESGKSDTLIYSGQGGHGFFGSKSKSPPKDQELVSGNLALKNSMDMKSVVRVIRKVVLFGKDVFVYDGLYIVNRCAIEKSPEGKNVFKFHLNRVIGQPSLQKMLKW